MTARYSEPRIPSSEITPQSLYTGRREFLASVGTTMTAIASGALTSDVLLAADKLSVATKTATTTEPLTPYKAVVSYNNFYEFGSEKDDPAKNSKAFKAKPWSVAIEGA